MGKILTDQATDTVERIDLDGSTLLPAPAAAPARRAHRTARLGLAVGAIVATAAAATILLGTALPMITGVPAQRAALPAMSSSMGFWDFVSSPKPAQPATSTGAPFAQSTLAEGRTAAPVSPAVPSRHDTRAAVAASEQAAAPAPLPAMSNSMGYWDHVNYHTAAPPAITHSVGFRNRIQALDQAPARGLEFYRYSGPSTTSQEEFAHPGWIDSLR